MVEDKNESNIAPKSKFYKFVQGKRAKSVRNVS